MIRHLRPLIFAVVVAIAVAPASAGDVTGVWLREDGNTKIKLSPCSAALCGFVAWKRKAGASGRIGQQVLFDMKQAGDNEWHGAAFNAEDGNTYSGKMKLVGETLTTTGCMLGGLLCKSYDWSRAN